MKMRGRRIALQCSIAVGVVQGFTFGPKLQRATVPGRGDSSVDDVTGLLRLSFYPVSTLH